MKDKIFIDTNIVVYAHLKEFAEIAKWEVAYELIIGEVGCNPVSRIIA